MHWGSSAAPEVGQPLSGQGLHACLSEAGKEGGLGQVTEALALALPFNLSALCTGSQTAKGNALPARVLTRPGHSVSPALGLWIP